VIIRISLQEKWCLTKIHENTLICILIQNERMKIAGVIPARYASTRFPGKPLTEIAGKSMIQRVYERCMQANILTGIVVATDDTRIEQHVKNFGGNVILTSPYHQSGTDRCNEVVQNNFLNYDVVINIQGDEPFINPAQISEIASCFSKENVNIATLVKKINTTEELFDVNKPKVILNCKNEAVYFSRSPIPFLKNIEKTEWHKHHQYYKHIGIYAYRPQVLKILSGLSPSLLEKAESLEQLRWIENGYTIHVSVTEHESVSIDTPEDLKNLLLLMKQHPSLFA
jgi:3-deoxy-manno-octulosonate cytidylyltransferase (CMP-KDO synthetase)